MLLSPVLRWSVARPSSFQTGSRRCTANLLYTRCAADARFPDGATPPVPVPSRGSREPESNRGRARLVRRAATACIVPIIGFFGRERKLHLVGGRSRNSTFNLLPPPLYF